MVAIIATEQGLGHLPRDVSEENMGYDVESLIPAEGNRRDKLRFIEVKGCIRSAPTVTITKGGGATCRGLPRRGCLRHPRVAGGLRRADRLRGALLAPALHATSVNYDWQKLWERGTPPW
jgi:hypothetical protein